MNIDMLSKDIKEKYDTIDLFERFKSLSNAYKTDFPLESYSKDKVLGLFENSSYEFKFDENEAFFTLKSLEDNYEFRFNMVLKYGIVETIFWAKNVKSNEQYGGPLSRLIKLIQKSNDVKDIERIGYPRYSSYDELKKIVIELLEIYEDFKKEFLKEERRD